MTLIDAIFINKGGGAVLLDYLISKILETSESDQFYFLLDTRYKKPENLINNYTILDNSLKSRIKYYKEKKDLFTKVFCFANTPPPIKLKVPVYTYLHNQKLLEAPRRKFEKDYRKIFIKYLFIRLFNNNTDYYVVQTPHMVAEMQKLKLKSPQHYLTVPFYDNSKYGKGFSKFEDRKKDEFVFISNPSPQKNYPNLLGAWEVLFNKGYKPILHVTIDETAPNLLNRLEEMKRIGINIVNHTYLDPRVLYYTCPYLIFPSVMESFGLPLLEATDSGMKILASDLPYVYDVIVPGKVFNPFDKNAIADAVITTLNNSIPFSTIVTKNEIEKLISLLV